MKRKTAIARAEKRAVRRWVKRYQSTYAGVMDDRDAEIERQSREAQECRERVTQWSNRSARAEKECGAAQERLRQLDIDKCAEIERLRAQVAKLEAGDCPRPISCFRLQAAEFRASSLESDLASLTRERDEADELARMWSADALTSGGELREARAEYERLTQDRDQWKAAFDNKHEHACILVRKMLTMGDAVGCGPDATPDDILKAVMGMRAENGQARIALGIHGNESLLDRILTRKKAAQEQIEAAEANVERLTAALTGAENRAAGSEAYANTLKPCDAQTLAYAENWRLVLAMPVGYALAREVSRPDLHPWICNCGGGRIIFHATPEEALRAAGVTVPEPEPCGTDDVAAALRAEDAAEAEDGPTEAWVRLSAVVDYLHDYGLIMGDKPIPALQRPDGRTCGYCQKCWRDGGGCVCAHNEIVAWLEGLEKRCVREGAGHATDTDRLDFLESLRRNGRSVGSHTLSAYHVVIDFTAVYDGEPVTVRQAIDAEQERRRGTAAVEAAEEGEGAEQ